MLAPIFTSLVFPPLDPVVLSLGPLTIRWYALAYLAGFVIGWRLALKIVDKFPNGVTRQHIDDYLTWAIIGTILGGRLGYVMFYQTGYYFDHPLEILQVWHGGMSFHGGMLGVIAAAWLFMRRAKLPFLALTDILAIVTPIGLFFGRLANFVNGELFGRASDAPWAIIFPRGGDVPRHPSQLYEAGLEGALLFILLMLISRSAKIRERVGMISGFFLIGYGFCRSFAEFFREPDVQLGFMFGGATMGQLLCIPMIVAGIIITLRSGKLARS